MHTPPIPKKTFKWTRQLIQLALSDGWSTQEIANKCRTQPTIVSDWKKGIKSATEAQLQPLLHIYGHKIKTDPFQVYWSVHPETNEKHYYKVEGKVIFSQVFYSTTHRESDKTTHKTPLYKLVVHYQGKGQFRLISQSRFAFRKNHDETENSNENAIWNAVILEPMDITRLLKTLDKFIEDFLSKEFSGDSFTLPFLIRQALLNHGFHVADVKEFPTL